MPSRVVTIPDAGAHDLWDEGAIVPAVAFGEMGYYILSRISRDRATTDRNYFVSMDGSDTNTGHTIAQAWRNPQRAANYLAESVDFGRKTINVRISEGDYAGVYNQSYFGGGQLNWIGDKINPGNVILRNSFNNSGFEIGSFNLLQPQSSVVTLNGFRLQPNNRPCIDADAVAVTLGVNGQIFFGDFEDFSSGKIEIAGCQGNSAPILGNLQDFGNNILVDGAALINPSSFLHSLTNSDIFMASTLTITGNPTFSDAFYIIVRSRAAIFSTYVGSAIGKKYRVLQNGFLVTDNRDGIPGTLDGVVESGGQVVYGSSFDLVQNDRHNITPLSTPHTHNNGESGKHFDNIDKAVLQQFNLPPAEKNMEFNYYVDNANGIRVNAVGDDNIRLEGVSPSVGTNAESTQPGSYLTLRCHSSQKWVAKSFTGLWAVA